MNQKFLKYLLLITLIVENIRAQREYPDEFSIEIIDGEEFVLTPFGLMLRECVQNVPSGTYVQENEDGILLLTNNQVNFSKTIPRNDKCIQRNPTPNLNKWIDNCGWDLPDGLTLSKFESNYRVPNTPMITGEQILYYFIGSQNNDVSSSTVSIIQPVLAYRKGWYFQSWNCCPFGQAQNSDAIYNINPYDIIYGSIEVGENDVTIISENTVGQQSKLIVSKSNRNFNWIDATFEAYNYDQCNNFPTDYIEYSNMRVTLSNGSNVLPDWYDDYGISECDGQITIINPSTVRIQHNTSTYQ